MYSFSTVIMTFPYIHRYKQNQTSYNGYRFEKEKYVAKSLCLLHKFITFQPLRFNAEKKSGKFNLVTENIN